MKSLNLEPIDSQVVAIHNFDPSSIEWPFENQPPLGLKVGQTYKILVDHGIEWVYGMMTADSTKKGYFPRNYTITIKEYYKHIQGLDEHYPDSMKLLSEQSESIEETLPISVQQTSSETPTMPPSLPEPKV